MSISKAGQALTTLEEWLTYAPPKAAYHWVDGRSAKEVARAWLAAGNDGLPPEVSEVLGSHSEFGRVHSWRAEPEAKLRFDSFAGEPRNSDLVVYATDSNGPYVLAVEAKADEPYGETVAQALANAMKRRIGNPRSNGIARIEQLALSHLREEAARIGDLRYQLLTACAGAVAEARRAGCSRALMLIHEFVTPQTKDENHKRNALDLSAFVHRLSGGEVAEVKDSRLYGPYTTGDVPGTKLFIGKVVRQLRSGGA